MPTLSWRSKQPEPVLRKALRLLENNYPVRENKRCDLAVEFKKITSDKRICRITLKNKQAVIEYSDLTAALRGIGRLLCEDKPQKDIMAEETNFKTTGIMLDCSRNAVMKPEHFKEWLRKIALLGFNMAMLYTEDTYELKGEPYFGYQRGRYTAEELREIDEYAASLGIEMIGCIQTLGHCEQILKWSAYNKIKDTSQVLLVGEDETYKLIEKMVSHFSRTYKSRRIHIGMDEADSLGRGRFMDLNGVKPPFEIFNEHLHRVSKICKKYGLEPLIWSDMYFALNSKSGGYYDKTCKIPGKVKTQIPENVQLVYWDYYHNHEAFYLDWIKRHRALGREPIMASGIWTWHSFWYDRFLTERNAGACVAACRKAGIREIFFTMWGDDGAYCCFDSALAGMAYVSELMYSTKISQKTLKQRFSAVCGGSYEAVRLASDLNMHSDINLAGTPIEHTNSAFFWDDPLLAIYYRNKSLSKPKYWPKMRSRYKKLISLLAKKGKTKDMKHALLLCLILYHKIDIAVELENAYLAGGKNLKNISRKIQNLIKLLIRFDKSFTNLWLARNKPQGLEVFQIRIAGLIRRYDELYQRLRQVISGKRKKIDEFENIPGRPLSKLPRRYRDVATGSSIL